MNQLIAMYILLVGFFLFCHFNMAFGNKNETFTYRDCLKKLECHLDLVNVSDTVEACIKVMPSPKMDFMEAYTACKNENSKMLRIDNEEIDTFYKEILNGAREDPLDGLNASLGSIWILLDHMLTKRGKVLTGWPKYELTADPYEYQCGVINKDGWRIVDCNEKHSTVCTVDIEGLYPSEVTGMDTTHVYFNFNMSEKTAPHETFEVECFTEDFLKDETLTIWLTKKADDVYFKSYRVDMSNDFDYSYTTITETDNPCISTTLLKAVFKIERWMHGWKIACFRESEPSPYDLRYCEDNSRHCALSPTILLDFPLPQMTGHFSRHPNIIFKDRPLLMTWTVNYKHLEFRKEDLKCEFSRNPIPRENLKKSGIKLNKKKRQLSMQLSIPSMQLSYTNTSFKCYLEIGLFNDWSICSPVTFCTEKTIRVISPPGGPEIDAVYDMQPSTVLEGMPLVVTCRAFVGDGGNLTWMMLNRENETIPPENYTQHGVEITHDVSPSHDANSTLTVSNVRREHDGLIFLCFSYVEFDLSLDTVLACPKDYLFCAQSKTTHVQETILLTDPPYRRKKMSFVIILLAIATVGGSLLTSMFYLVVTARRRRRKAQQSHAEDQDQGFVSDLFENGNETSRSHISSYRKAPGSDNKSSVISNKTAASSVVYEQIGRDGSVALVMETTL